MRHVYDNTKVVQSLNPAVVTTATVGQSFVDTLGYNDGMLIVSVGAITATASDLYTVTVFEGDVTSTMVATSIAVTFGFVSGASNEGNSLKVARIVDVGVSRKRYLQARLSMTATTISFAGSALIALSGPDSGAVNIP